MLKELNEKIEKYNKTLSKYNDVDVAIRKDTLEGCKAMLEKVIEIMNNKTVTAKFSKGYIEGYFSALEDIEKLLRGE